MKVTGPMIERGLAAYQYESAGYADPAALVERILRAALNDPVDPLPAVIPGQMNIDGEVVVADG